jgi:nitrous oxidase accessory protein NosD
MRGAPAAAAVAVVCGALALAGPAAARIRTVEPGHSIQAAIDRSKPGDTVRVKHGGYAESLQITTDRLKLRGENVTLTQPDAPADTACGICISHARGVHVSGFRVRGFGGDGVFILGARRTVLRGNKLVHNGGYGSFADASRGTRYVANIARHNGDAGLYVGDSPKANATIRNNVSAGNSDAGILLRNAIGGRVRDNLLGGNCAGLVVLADAPGPAGRFKIERNGVIANNRACPADEEDGAPAISGIGIGLFGARGTTVRDNTVSRNRDGNPSFVSGGIVVTKGLEGAEPQNDLVEGNRLARNSPFDVDWDGSGTVRFNGNTCARSQPSGLCE